MGTSQHLPPTSWGSRLSWLPGLEGMLLRKVESRQGVGWHCLAEEGLPTLGSHSGAVTLPSSDPQALYLIECK